MSRARPALRRRAAIAALLALVWAAPGGARAEGEPRAVDVELVLAVDVSRSIDAEERWIQREGYVEALTHPAVIDAISRGPLGRIAIAYTEWGGPYQGNVVLDWTVLSGRADAEAAARALSDSPVGAAMGTSISAALLRAAEMIEGNAITGARRVIDISGDGPNNTGPPVTPARDQILARGIEINGLPVMIAPGWGGFDISTLDLYYRDCVIGGPTAFVIPVLDASRFATAIRQKLVLEIAGLAPPAQARVIRARGPTDCLIGEKQREIWMRERGWE